MSTVSTTASLEDYQRLIRQLVVERGFEEETASQVFTLLVEEVGELAKAIRKVNGQKTGAHSRGHNLSEEAAEVFWLLLHLCNILDINLAAAFAAKEAKNQDRSYHV